MEERGKVQQEVLTSSPDIDLWKTRLTPLLCILVLRLQVVEEQIEKSYNSINT